MSQRDQLTAYRSKRRPEVSGEPTGGTPREKQTFVIQRHDSRRLHFDLRLEIGGVLVSWAVPRGPSQDPSEKRLAVRTEDHPLDYARFEGVIPGGEYGAGRVVVWDIGTYQNISHDRHDEPVSIEEALERGHIGFWLHGTRLTGPFALTKTPTSGRQEPWLLVKARGVGTDRRAHPALTSTESVLTGQASPGAGGRSV
ncbi:DNA polymerase ligase N-terminal domain-containing protein [Actinoalloteichus hymeniacidonis]|uniref:DNA ligase D-like 3'-phosphoesterase domain-containing protein n=1 Tax=Actinoalloteichus hymeniacidonis TaxID=340345 RepID=A0AAC9HPU6_9PSEU|nr:DNA polymerase ligase N-terminal domain-containing protein [Actinoalloteichus hymeniacidonis]AOS63274.1 DNA ligase D-like 3'-phosphoesterase domain-containing protein [Actinoalloteichus hymeniacidonis]MBB5908687.1 bifunctional non-homologous end joining protein LigD [Actinoalloteichus hymeniacidonis]